MKSSMRPDRVPLVWVFFLIASYFFDFCGSRFVVGVVVWCGCSGCVEVV